MLRLYMPYVREHLKAAAIFLTCEHSGIVHGQKRNGWMWHLIAANADMPCIESIQLYIYPANEYYPLVSSINRGDDCQYVSNN